MTRRIANILIVSALAAGTGCSSVMTGLVGDPHGPQGAPKSAAPTPFMGLSYTSTNIDAQSRSASGYGSATQTILPPTVPAASPGEGVEDTDSLGTAGPRPAIAVAPLTQEAAQLGGLGQAAAREAGKSDHAHFVLLVLTPPASDTGSIGAIGTQSHGAAEAALHAITAAGVAADRVEISSATAVAGNPGEIRLYVR